MLTYVFEKQSRVLTMILLIISALLIFYFERFGSLTSRYMVYVFIAPICFVAIFNLKNDIVRAAIPFFVLFFIEITIISRIPLITLPINNINPTFVSTGITLAFALVILISKFYNYETLYLPAIYKALFLIFITALLISLAIGSELGIDYLAVNVNEFITYYLEFILFFYLGYYAFNNLEDVNKIITVFILFGVITAIGHIFSITTGIQLGAIRGSEMVNEDLDLVGRNWRYGGFFGNPNTMAAYYVMIVPACLHRLVKSKNLLTTFLSGSGLLLMITSLFFSGSRGAILFLALNLFLFLFFLKLKMKNLFSLIIGILFMLAIINIVSDQFLADYVERTITNFTKRGTDSPRWLIWPLTIEIIIDNPLGIGISTYNFIVQLSSYGNLFWANPHSVYLAVLTQGGVIGFVVFMLIFIKIISSGIHTYNRIGNVKQKEVIGLLLLIIFGFLMMGVTEPIFRNQYKINHFIAFVLGVLLSISIRQKFNLFNIRQMKKNEAIIQNKR